MATERLNLRNNIKNHLLRSHKWDESEKFAELFITLASIKIVFLLLLLMHFGCYGKFKFPLTSNWEKLKLAFSLQIFVLKVCV